MGGYGSTRWGFHRRKTTVEESKRLEIKHYTRGIRELEAAPPDRRGRIEANPSWTCRGKPSGNVGLIIEGSGDNLTARVSYQVTLRQEEPRDYKYRVGLQYSLLTWGDRRWWWTCPRCNRRAGILYLPGWAYEFACRRCHDLTYTSCQESGANQAMWGSLAVGMQDSYPGITGKEVQRLFDKNEVPERFLRRDLERFLEEWANYDPYEGYLTAGELCDQSGLTPGQFDELAAARLLLSDTKDGRYRPKLSGWAAKRAYLLEEGWAVAEVKRWAKGRWKVETPRQWPPEKDQWE